MDDTVTRDERRTEATRDERGGEAPARPTRDEAEAAVRTLIAWAGDNPNREGLLDTPRRVVKAYEELFAGYRQDAGQASSAGLRRRRRLQGPGPRPRHSLHLALRAPHRAVHRQGAYRLLPAPRRRRPVEARAHRRHFRAPAADPGGAVGADRQRDRRRAQHPRRRGDDRGRAHLHVDARREEGRRLDRDDPVHWRLPLAAQRADPLPHPAARRALTMADAAANDLEEGFAFTPRFSTDGLITCVAVDAGSGEVLMLAHMNAEALERTLATGVMHYWSRSRQRLWRKGDTLRPGPDRGRTQGRLRPGRAARPGQGRRRRRGLPHRPSIVFLPARRNRADGARLAPVEGCDPSSQRRRRGPG